LAYGEKKTIKGLIDEALDPYLGRKKFTNRIFKILKIAA
jgi:hypothetical protein